MTAAQEAIGRCRLLAECSEEPGFTTRTFLSPPMHQVHTHVREWMETAGMTVEVDAAGNIRGRYAGAETVAPTLWIGSHLDTVPRAGAFDGVLGVMMGIALMERLAGRRLRFAIEVVGFSEEEGVRFGVPFIGSRALAGDIDPDLLEQISGSIRAFGLDPGKMAEAEIHGGALGYLEFHIEQGRVLESAGIGLGVVDAISGQSRFALTFQGEANHAATPMGFRRDALAAAAEWIVGVEWEANITAGMTATVGQLDVEPGAGNVVAGVARASLDVRHRDDGVRSRAAAHMLACARQISQRRGLSVSWENRLDRAAVPMDAGLKTKLERAVERCGHPVHTLTSGAGHDAMIMASRMPACMLFLRSPGGISHHPNEAVLPEDVEAGLDAGMRFLEDLDA